MTLNDAGVNSGGGDVVYCNDKFILNSQPMNKIRRNQRPSIILSVKSLRNVGQSTTLLTIFCLLPVFLSSLSGVVTGNSLEEVDDQELQKLLTQENYVAVLFSKLSLLSVLSAKKDPEFLGQLIVLIPSKKPPNCALNVLSFITL